VRHRTLGILAGALMVSGAALGAGTAAFAIASGNTVTYYPSSAPLQQQPGAQNPGQLGPGMHQRGPGFGQPGSGMAPQGPGMLPPWDRNEASPPAPQP